MITKLNVKFGENYKATSKGDLLKIAKKYLNEEQLNKMLARVNDYENYELVQDGYLGIKRMTQRTYIVELL